MVRNGDELAPTHARPGLPPPSPTRPSLNDFNETFLRDGSVFWKSAQRSLQSEARRTMNG